MIAQKDNKRNHCYVPQNHCYGAQNLDMQRQVCATLHGSAKREQKPNVSAHNHASDSPLHRSVPTSASTPISMAPSSATMADAALCYPRAPLPAGACACPTRPASRSSPRPDGCKSRAIGTCSRTWCPSRTHRRCVRSERTAGRPPSPTLRSGPRTRSCCWYGQGPCCTILAG